ncbi:MAG: hypothetical protein WAM92_11425 [Mycobacterium sp.]
MKWLLKAPACRRNQFTFAEVPAEASAQVSATAPLDEFVGPKY